MMLQGQFPSSKATLFANKLATLTELIFGEGEDLNAFTQ